MCNTGLLVLLEDRLALWASRFSSSSCFCPGSGRHQSHLGGCEAASGRCAYKQVCGSPGEWGWYASAPASHPADSMLASPLGLKRPLPKTCNTTTTYSQTSLSCHPSHLFQSSIVHSISLERGMQFADCASCYSTR